MCCSYILCPLVEMDQQKVGPRWLALKLKERVNIILANKVEYVYL